ncbi:SDR family NAD(P)-dependent oxidoreductase [Streptomyces sp. NPDC026672]|uniref:SDR family NAD(P)-dependent oxidoreductase n=1 Tax=unclassified Streptomyces TaxID=2593676 RepID=UPI0033E8F747
MTDVDAVRATVDQAAEALGRLDVVVNNAGYGLFGAAEEFTDEQIDHHLATNLGGPIAVARAALPYLRGQGGGRIVQISTYGGQAANAGGSLYSAGKFGIEGFVEALAAEVAPFNIGVTIVEPGGTGTGFRRNALFGTPMAAYDGTPAAAVRGLSGSSRPSPDDPVKVAALTITAALREPAPLRVVLGSDSYQFVHQALTDRVADVTDQAATAAASDRDQVPWGLAGEGEQVNRSSP